MPHPAETCPGCGFGTAPAGTGGDGAAGGGSSSGAASPGGPPPLIEYDPEAIGAAANGARSVAEAIRASVSSRAGGLATTAGELRIVAALAAATAARSDQAERLASEVSTVSTNLGLALADYTRVDDDVALALTALLGV
ncbi:MAG TPA: hypothetical protein VGD67_13980 [Pseudonocardiaceae bacterium]